MMGEGTKNVSIASPPTPCKSKFIVPWNLFLDTWFLKTSRIKAQVKFWDVLGLLRNSQDNFQDSSGEKKGVFTWLIFHACQV